jgi:4-hydroxy-tetrahydrodipicolinate reductase
MISIESAPVQESARQVGVILFGVGALGSLVLKCLDTGYPLIRVVGAVDHAADKVGRPLAELHPGPAAAGGVVVRDTLAACLADCRDQAGVVYHLTESVPSHIEGQLTEALAAGLDVISASEAMFHPALRYADFAARIDAAARAAGVSIMGVGINPGFSFDSVPLALARATSGVRRVTISRAIDVTGTGPGDIDHVGYGLWPDEFHRKIAAGRIVGHMGMPESIAAVAERLGMEIDRVEETWEVETADVAVDSGAPALGMIAPGRVIGITQTGAGRLGEATVITMRLLMYYQPDRFGIDLADTIDIEGAHHIRASIRPAALSLFGAANTIVNATHDVIAAPPGLGNILDAGVAGIRRGGFRYELDPAPAPRGVVRLRRAAV